MRHRLLLTLCLICPMAWAEIPHQFFRGKVAKATEVNANFAYLDQRLSAVETSSNSGGDNYVPINNDYSYTYDPIASTVGDIITIDEQEYVIGAFPIIEIATGEKYVIKMPVLLQECIGNACITDKGIHLNYGSSYPLNDNIDPLSNVDTILHYPLIRQEKAGLIDTSFRYEVRATGHYSATFPHVSDVLILSVYNHLYLLVQINETRFGVSFYHKTFNLEVPIDEQTYDYSTLIDAHILDEHDYKIDQLRFLANHLSIIKSDDHADF